MSTVFENEPLPENWYVYYTDAGTPYFYNSVTEITQWQKPMNYSEKTFSFNNIISPKQNTDSTQNLKELDFIDITDDKISSQMNFNNAYSTNVNETSHSSYASPEPLTFFFINISFLKKYFNVNTSDVLERLYHVLTINKWNFLPNYTIYQNEPDFYGPFWITTSMIMLLFGTKNIYAFLIGHSSKSYIAFTAGSWFLYSYVIIIPLIIWLVSKLIGNSENSSISLIELISVYGYSMILCAPVFLLLIIKISFIRFVVCILGAVYSIMFCSSCILAKTTSKKLKTSITGVLLLSQFLLYAIIPFYFF